MKRAITYATDTLPPHVEGPGPSFEVFIRHFMSIALTGQTGLTNSQLQHVKREAFFFALGVFAQTCDALMKAKIQVDERVKLIRETVKWGSEFLPGISVQ